MGFSSTTQLASVPPEAVDRVGRHASGDMPREVDPAPQAADEEDGSAEEDDGESFDTEADEEYHDDDGHHYRTPFRHRIAALYAAMLVDEERFKHGIRPRVDEDHGEPDACVFHIRGTCRFNEGFIPQTNAAGLIQRRVYSSNQRCRNSHDPGARRPLCRQYFSTIGCRDARCIYSHDLGRDPRLDLTRILWGGSKPAATGLPQWFLDEVLESHDYDILIKDQRLWLVPSLDNQRAASGDFADKNGGRQNISIRSFAGADPICLLQWEKARIDRGLTIMRDRQAKTAAEAAATAAAGQRIVRPAEGPAVVSIASGLLDMLLPSSHQFDLIISHLDHGSVLTLASTCKRLHFLADQAMQREAAALVMFQEALGDFGRSGPAIPDGYGDGTYQELKCSFLHGFSRERQLIKVRKLLMIYGSADAALAKSLLLSGLPQAQRTERKLQTGRFTWGDGRGSITDALHRVLERFDFPVSTTGEDEVDMSERTYCMSPAKVRSTLDALNREPPTQPYRRPSWCDDGDYDPNQYQPFDTAQWQKLQQFLQLTCERGEGLIALHSVI